MDDAELKLVAEQLQHTLDLFRAEVETLRSASLHEGEVYRLRLERLEAQAADFEQRMRQLTDSATQFRMLASLATGGGLLSLITLLRVLGG